jgi:hypothetical protein
VTRQKRRHADHTLSGILPRLGSLESKVATMAAAAPNESLSHAWIGEVRAEFTAIRAEISSLRQELREATGEHLSVREFIDDAKTRR